MCDYQEGSDVGFFSKSAPAEPEPEPISKPEQGPYDVEHHPETAGMIDLGALRVPSRQGMSVRLDIDKPTGVATGLTIVHGDSMLKVQAFAAPRTAGIWDEIRTELAQSIVAQGGKSDHLPGRFGEELQAKLPGGKAGGQAVRFLGVDGPRWFVRGVVTGRAANDPVAARPLEDVFAKMVVVRGQSAKIPRELLPLTLPGEGQTSVAKTPPTLESLARGPEMTETR